MITRKTLWDYDSEIQNVYQTIYDAVMNPQMPSLHNTEGDPLVPHQLTYELLVSPGDAFDGLADLNCSESRVQILEQGECNSGVLRRIAFSWSKKGNSKHAGMDNTVLGQIEIDGPKMVVNVNSAERAEEFEILLKTRLEGKYKAKPRFIESIEHGLMNRPVSSASGRSEHDELMKHPEVQAKIAQMMKAHGMIGSINRFLRSVTRRRLRPQSPARLERNLVPSLSNLKLKPNCDLNRAQAQNFSKRSEINLVC